MAIEPQTRRQLLELAYDLLPPTEAAALRRKIKADPELAKAYAQVRHELRLLAEAAKIEAEEVDLRRPLVTVARPQPARKRRTLRDRLRLRWPLMRGANWVVGLLAAFFTLVALGGFAYHYRQLSGIAAEQLRLLVVGPSSVQEGVPGVYTVFASSITGAAAPAQVELSVVLPNGQCLWRDKDKCDAQGRLCVTLPADLKITPESRLDVLAVSQGNYARLDAPLRIAPPRFTAILNADKPVLAPGQSLRWRLDLVGPAELADEGSHPFRLALLDASGQPVAGLAHEGTTQRGIAEGEFPLPASIAAGRYWLTAQPRGGVPLEGKRLIEVRAASSASQGPEAPAGPRPVRVQLFPEGGAAVADVENRIYLLARDEAGQPAAVKGVILDGRGSEVAAFATQEQGLGSLRFTPLGGESYRLRITEPAEAKAEEPLAKIADDSPLALSAPSSLIEAGKPLPLAIRTRRSGMPLIVSVSCRGAVAAQQPLVTDLRDGGLHLLSIPLPPEAAGVLCVSVYDCSGNAPRAVAERLVYRKPARRLALRVEGLEKHYAPGAKAALKISVTNEQAARVDAVLSLTARREAADAPAALDETADLAAVYLGSPGAAAALDLALGVDGWRRFVPAKAEANHAAAAEADSLTPLVLDNIAQLRETYRKNLAAYQSHQTRALAFLAIFSLLGGLGLVLLVGMLVLLRVATGAHLWVMAIGTAACCVTTGAILSFPSPSESNEAAKALVSFDGPARDSAGPQGEAGRPGPVVREYAGELLGDAPLPSTAAGAALWMPVVPTANGTAEVTFDAPAEPGTWFLEIDARGDGRLGRQRVPLIAKPKSAANGPAPLER